MVNIEKIRKRVIEITESRRNRSTGDINQDEAMELLMFNHDLLTIIARIETLSTIGIE